MILSRSSLDISLSQDILLGSLVTLVASLSLAASSYTGKVAGRSTNVWSLSFWSMLIFGASLIPFSNFQKLSLIGVDQLYTMLYLSVICTAVAFLLWNTALKSTDSLASITSTMHLKTPVTVLIGVSVGEVLTIVDIFFMAIIVAMVYFTQSNKGSITNRTQPESKISEVNT